MIKKERVVKKKINRLKKITIKKIKTKMANSGYGWDYHSPTCTDFSIGKDAMFVIVLLEKPKDINKLWNGKYFKINYQKYNSYKWQMKIADSEYCEKLLQLLINKKYNKKRR